MNQSYNIILDDISGNNNHLYSTNNYSASKFVDEVCHAFSEDWSDMNNVFSRVKQCYPLGTKEDIDNEKVTNHSIKDSQYQPTNINYCSSGAKVLIKEKNEEALPCMSDVIKICESVMASRAENNNDEENYHNPNGNIREAIKTALDDNQMEVEDVNEVNDNNNNSIISDEIINNTANILKSGYLLPTSVHETIVSQPIDDRCDRRDGKTEEITNQFTIQNLTYPVVKNDVCQSDLVDCEGRLNIPLPLDPPKPLPRLSLLNSPGETHSANNINIRKSKKDDNVKRVTITGNEDSDARYKQLSEEVLKRNNVTSEELINLLEKHQYQQPDGSVYTIPEDIDKNELEERMNGNYMPPQPEYFDPDNKELGFKCNYDMKHPHPYINPFEMFALANSNTRRKLKSSKKYSFEDLSNGRIICLICAVLHKKEIKRKQLQDWDVIDTHGRFIKQCKSCKKYKKAMHFKKRNVECSFCASRRSFGRYIKIN